MPSFFDRSTPGVAQMPNGEVCDDLEHFYARDSIVPWAARDPDVVFQHYRGFRTPEFDVI